MVNYVLNTEHVENMSDPNDIGETVMRRVFSQGTAPMFDQFHVLTGGASPTAMAWGHPQTVVTTAEADTIELMYENAVLRRDNAVLSQQFDELRQRLASLEEHVRAAEPAVVVLRELTREEARAEIVELFSDGETHDYEDIVTRLRIDLEMVVELCNELIDEGEIGPGGDQL